MRFITKKFTRSTGETGWGTVLVDDKPKLKSASAPKTSKKKPAKKRRGVSLAQLRAKKEEESSKKSVRPRKKAK